MSRPRWARRHWTGRHPKTTALLALAVTGWTVTHPWKALAAGITLAAAGGFAAWGRAVWRARHTLPANMEPVGLYCHYFTNAYPVYGGITNDYRARCIEHMQGSWWWPYVDHSRSTFQEWTAADCPPGWTPRDLAKAAETAFITQYAPIGNTAENPLWWEQEPYRRQLKAAVGWVDRPAPAQSRRRLSWRAA
jgi:hypothetical protein